MHGDELHEEEIEKANHFTWNLRVNVCVESFWGFAMALISTATIIPVFLSKLGASERMIALVPGITLVGWASLQLPSAYYTTRLRRKMGPVVWLHVPIVLLWMGAALVARDLAATRPDVARWLFLVLMGAAYVVGSIAIPMWADFLNRQTPASKRGRFLAWMFAAASCFALLGGIVAQRILDHFEFPLGFAICFFVAACCMMVGLLPYMLVREVAMEPTRFESARVFARHIWSIVRSRGGLKRLVVTRCLMESGIMAGAFYAVNAMDVAHLPLRTAATFTIITTAATAPMTLLAGYVGERWGFRIVLVFAGLFGAAATALALLGGGTIWFYVMFAMVGLAVACDLSATMNMVIEMSPDRDKTVYQAIYNTMLMPMRIAYPLLAGWLAAERGMATLFAVALALQLCGAVAAAVVVREPRKNAGVGEQ